MSVITETLADLASSALLRTTRVADVTHPTPDFVRVTLQADAFRGTAWTPGAKLQLRPRRGTFLFRTYTPIRWDAQLGITELIAFTHADGPAADWFRAVAVDDVCEVFGPRRSIDLPKLAGRVVFVGDESSVGLACALQSIGLQVDYCFEAAEPDSLRNTLSDLGFQSVSVVPKAPERDDLLESARSSAEAGAGAYTLLVTGKAGTVHALRRASRHWATAPRRVEGKAYWAPGRTGLD
jgi:ferric-chelate reductase (NADPH)